jgi:polysaccharide biosynthesis protein PslG
VRARRALTGLGALILAVAGCGGSSPHVKPVTSTPGATTAPAGSARAVAFGADVDQLFLGPGADTGEADRQLTGAAAAGLGLARVAPLWEFTEPRPPVGGVHHYDWRYDDLIAGRLAAHGFRWVALLAYAPGWASATATELHGAPSTPSDYAAYAAAVAARYRGRIAAYEIWNEENSSVFWRPAPDPAAYAQLYLAARAAIHRVDPGVPVLIGGLANTGSAYLAELLRRPELRGQVDGVAVHPYGRDPAEVLDRVRGYRLQLRGLGAGDVPLYVTEYGWATEPVGGRTYATAAERGPFIGAVAQALLRSDCQVRMVVFYAWTTAQSNPASADQWYGVASADGAPNSGTAAVAAAARALVAPAGAPVQLCGGGKGLTAG